jgi:fatty-acyl-CoA synthase
MTLAEKFVESTVASALASRATSDANAMYLHFGDVNWTFGQVDSDAEALAAALSGLGLTVGDRIALVLPPRPEFAIAMFAAAKLGATIVPLNPRLTSGELQYALRHSGAACAVVIEQAHGTDYLALFEELMPQLPDLRHLVTVGEEELWYDDRIFQFEDLVSSGVGRDFHVADIAPADRFALVYTSGTIGKPKGVELSHANLMAAAAGTADAIGLGSDDRVIGVSALFHVFGLGPGLLSSLLAGASLVLQEESGAAATLDDIERHGATVHYGIPTLFLSELSELESRDVDLSTLRLAVVAGAPVSDELVDRIEAGLGVTVTTAYSMTETASTVSASRPDDRPDQRRFTVGRPIAATEVRVLETDGAELPVESVGEIAVRGPGVMLGYYRQPRETAAAFDDDGFFLTGTSGSSTRRATCIWSAVARTLSFGRVSTCTPGRWRLESSLIRRYRKWRWSGCPTRYSVKPSVPASSPWRARSSPGERSWTGAARHSRTTRSPTWCASLTSFLARTRGRYGGPISLERRGDRADGGRDVHGGRLRRLPRPHPRSNDADEVGRSRGITT